jgi:hypothetical protein
MLFVHDRIPGCELQDVRYYFGIGAEKATVPATDWVLQYGDTLCR